jgi:hypothetical protein
VSEKEGVTPADSIAFVKYAVAGTFELTVPDEVRVLTILAGGGGGAGGQGGPGVGGGGGAGAGLYLLELPVVPGEKIPIVVGAGGQGSNGENTIVGPWTLPGGGKGARGRKGEVVDPQAITPPLAIPGQGGEAKLFGTAGGEGSQQENGGSPGAGRKARAFPDGSVYSDQPGGKGGVSARNTSGGGGGGGGGLNGPGGAGGNGQKRGDGNAGESASDNCAGGGGGSGTGRGGDNPGAGGNGGPGWVGIWYVDPQIDRDNRISEIRRVIASSPEELRGEIAQLQEKKTVLEEEIADLKRVKEELR